MERVGGTSEDLRPPWGWIAALALIASIGVVACVQWLTEARDTPSAGWVVLSSGLLLVAGAAAGTRIQARSQAQRRALTESLRAARDRLRCLEELLDVWQWRSDAEHRLVELRPPQGAPESDWTTAGRLPSLAECFRPTDAEALRARFASRAPLDDLEVTLTSSTSTATRHGRLRGRPQVDASGAFAGYQGVVREIEGGASMPSPAAAPGAEAPTLPSGLDVAAEQESFSYTVSHDLRAPIRVVEGFTRIVKEDYGRLLDRVGNDHLDRVLAAAARMNNMIDALLALSRLASQPLARQPVNLSQLAGYVADDLRRQWPERDVTLHVEPGLQLSGDPTLLRVVLENLLGNAWKYTAKTAKAEVRVERYPHAADSYTVRDNGAGFDMRFADRLFGVFQRLHSANDFAGTGVGLASVRRIVRRHGGEIWGEAEVNRGASFHFSLPQTGQSTSPRP